MWISMKEFSLSQLRSFSLILSFLPLSLRGPEFACLEATTHPTCSINFNKVPPWTLPVGFASSGNINLTN